MSTTMTGRIFHPVATDAARDIVLQHASPARVVLWGGWFCPFTHRTWAALEAKGIPISQRKGVLSPHGLTPGLQVDGHPLYDSNIINEYIEEAGSSLGADQEASSLWPSNTNSDTAYEKARARLWIDHINKAVVPAFFRLLQATPTTQMAALAEFKTALVHITTSCKGPFFHGEHLSLVDLAIAPWAVRDFIIRDARGFRRDDVPGWAAWAKALERHQAIQKTTSDPDKYLEFNQTFMRNEDQSVAGKAARAHQTIL